MSDELFKILMVLNVASLGMIVGMYGDRIIAAIQGRSDDAKPHVWSLIIGIPVVFSFLFSLVILVTHLFF